MQEEKPKSNWLFDRVRKRYNQRVALFRRLLYGPYEPVTKQTLLRWFRNGLGLAAKLFTRSLALKIATPVFAAVLAACATYQPANSPTQAISFQDYRGRTLEQIRQARPFLLSDQEPELLWNGPQEWLPTSKTAESQPKKGILLVHGLGDSPWSFHDLAQQLASQGFLVRTVLLPGHGTHPKDLLTVTAEQWRQVVREQAMALRHDVDEVYLGGFSTGANLVLEYAYANPDIASLVLFSPGFKSFPFDWLAPLVAKIRPWVIVPDEKTVVQNTVRYLTVPSNGFAQYYYTSVTARKLLHERPYEKPVFMVVAQNDSVLDTDYLLDIFEQRFTHPQSRLVWYGEAPSGIVKPDRIYVRNDKLPEKHISQFSHMGLLFSPSNSLYGEKGSLRICLNGQGADATRACENGDSVWFSDWGYREEDKVHARLTFNPYFDWQGVAMKQVFLTSPHGDSSGHK